MWGFRTCAHHPRLDEYNIGHEAYYGEGKDMGDGFPLWSFFYPCIISDINIFTIFFNAIDTLISLLEYALNGLALLSCNREIIEISAEEVIDEVCLKN